MINPYSIENEQPSNQLREMGRSSSTTTRIVCSISSGVLFFLWGLAIFLTAARLCKPEDPIFLIGFLGLLFWGVFPLSAIIFICSKFVRRSSAYHVGICALATFASVPVSILLLSKEIGSDRLFPVQAYLS